jgi:hypothetical protein
MHAPVLQDPWHFGKDPDPDPDPDPAIFVTGLQDANKNFFLLSFTAYYFWKDIYIMFQR